MKCYVVLCIGLPSVSNRFAIEMYRYGIDWHRTNLSVRTVHM